MHIVHRSRWIYRRTPSPVFFETLEPRRLFAASTELSSDQDFHAWAFASLDVNMNLLHFTGAQPADGFQTDIDWGDGTDTTGAIQSLGADDWMLQGQHHYDQAGVYDVSFTVATSDGVNDGFGSWTVLAVGRDGIVPIEGDPHAYGDDSSDSDVLVDFQDTGMSDNTQYRATVDWGDGRITDGVVNTSQGQASVSADIQYDTIGAHEAIVTVQRLDSNGQVAAQTSIPVSIDYELLPIYLEPADDSRYIDYAGDGHLTGAIATFSTDRPIDAYSAQIDWGDGTTSTATITATGQLDDNGHPLVAVGGDHQYAPGDADYNMTISIQSTTGNQGTFNQQVSVGSDRLIGQPITTDPGQPAVWANDPAYATDGAVMSLGNVVDPAAPSDATYSVNVDWGDGTNNAGTAGAAGNNIYISGNHTYATNGVYSISVTVGRPSADGRSTISTSYNFSLQVIDPSELDGYLQQGRRMIGVAWYDHLSPILTTLMPGLVTLPWVRILAPEPTVSPPVKIDLLTATPPTGVALPPETLQRNVKAAPAGQLFNVAAVDAPLQSLLADDKDLLARPANEVL